MIKKHTMSPEKYFWTGLRDTNANGEYSWASVGGVKRAVTFSNWNFFEPGGCLSLKVVEYGHVRDSFPPRSILHLPLNVKEMMIVWTSLSMEP